MAGLARAQQLFNRAILAPIAALIAFSGSRQSAAAAQSHNKGHGHPVFAKYLKSNAPRANRPGFKYPGYLASSLPRKTAAQRSGLLPFGFSTKPDADNSVQAFNRRSH